MGQRFVAAIAVAIACSVVLGCRPEPVERATASVPPAVRELPGYNVLLITLDTTRADRLGAYGYDKARTPAFDGLAAGGALFERAYTSCPLTLPAHATLLTGLEPPEHGLRINGGARLGDRVPTLASILRTEGYRTGAFVAAFVLNRKFGLGRGFQTYDDDLSQAHSQDIPEQFSVHRDGDQVVDAALAWLDKAVPENPPTKQAPATSNRSPFFAWVHLYDPHYPYFVHPELAGTAFEGKESYDGDIAFMDLQVQRLLDYLKQRNLSERTLVVAVADHGEGLEDHGEFEHGYLLNEEVLRVPLVMSLPGVIKPGTRSAAIVSMVDVFPTVLDVLELSDKHQGRGRSLAQALEGKLIESRPSYAESDMPYTSYGWSPLRSLTTAEWKYIRTTRPELYARESDLREIFNLASVRPQQLAVLDSELASVENRMRPPKATGRVELSAKDRERMEALGYAAEQHPATSDAAAAADKAHPPAQPPPAALKDIKEMLATKHLDTTLFRGMVTGTLSPKAQIAMAQELVKRSPETASFHGRLGAAYLNAGTPQEAVGPLTEALRLRPGDSDAEINIGRALARTGKVADAIPHFRRVVEAEPTSTEAHLGLANALVDSGELDTACGHYAEVIRLQPENAEARFNLANTLARRRKSELAIEQYEEVIRLNPKFAGAHFNLANLLAALGRLDEAIAGFERTIRLEPANVDAINNLGVALARQGRRTEAKARYAEAAKLRPEFGRAHFNLGRELAEDRNFAAALAAYDRAVKLWPDEAEFAVSYARLLVDCPEQKLRNPKLAVELAEKVVENSNNSDAYVLDTLSLAYAAAGREREATAIAQRALRLAQIENRKALVAAITDRLGPEVAGQLASAPKTTAPDN